MELINKSTLKKHKRPSSCELNWITVHYTASPTCSGTVDWFSNHSKGGSAHYLICKNGKIYQFADPSKYCTWHTGCRDERYTELKCNEQSIGIELQHFRLSNRWEFPNFDWKPFTEKQYKSLCELVLWLSEKYNIPAVIMDNVYEQKSIQKLKAFKGITAHKTFTDKDCPSNEFNWDYFEKKLEYHKNYIEVDNSIIYNNWWSWINKWLGGII